MIEVDSSYIQALDYDREKSVLMVEFHKGGTYRYADVPIDVFSELCDSDSVGRYFLQNVRNNYQSEQISEGEPVERRRIEDSQYLSENDFYGLAGKWVILRKDIQHLEDTARTVSLQIAAMMATAGVKTLEFPYGSDEYLLTLTDRASGPTVLLRKL